MLAIVLSAASCTEGSPCSQSSLLLLSDDRDLLPALALLRRSGHFEQVLLVHSNSQAADHVTPAISLTQLLHCYRAAPSVCTSQLTDCGDAAEAHCQSAVHRSSHRGSIPGGITPPSSDIASAATTPSSVSVASCRSLYASTASALPCQPSASPSRSSECVQAFTAIVQCCEREKIIPRESVLRKKLLDSHSALCVEFEQFLSCVVDSGVGVVEGCSPQRVLWPREGQTARRFACADFFQPTQRLSAEQTQELIAFLYRVRPEVERGRFGFAQWLSRYGPRFIQALPHGVLVELVQLLLNKKVLQFRKGRVSVTTPVSTATLSSAVSAESLAAGFSSISALSGGSRASPGSVAARSQSAGDEGRTTATMKLSLMAVPLVSTPSDRAFIPASILPFSTPFNAVGLLFSLCSLRCVTVPSSSHQYPSHLPLYHYEQTASLTSSVAVWVAVCTVVFRHEGTSARSVARQFKSTQHRSKEAAQQESARRALQEALWYVCFDRCLTELKRLDNRQREGESREQRQQIRSEEQQRSEAEERYQQQTTENVTQLDRHLAFLSQPAIVYSLQSHVTQNSVGARTLWQARGQVMLEGQLLPSDRVRLRAWNGCELLLSSTPVVAYAAQAKKTEAKALVSQQLINKMAAATASLPAQPIPQTAALAKAASATFAAPPQPRYALQPSAAVNTTHRVNAAGILGEGSNTSWRQPVNPSTPSRSHVPLSSTTLFAFPSYSDLQPQSARTQVEYEHEGELTNGRVPASTQWKSLLIALDEYGGRCEMDEMDGEPAEGERAEGEQFI